MARARNATRHAKPVRKQDLTNAPAATRTMLLRIPARVRLNASLSASAFFREMSVESAPKNLCQVLTQETLRKISLSCFISKQGLRQSVLRAENTRLYFQRGPLYSDFLGGKKNLKNG